MYNNTTLLLLKFMNIHNTISTVTIVIKLANVEKTTMVGLLSSTE